MKTAKELQIDANPGQRRQCTGLGSAIDRHTDVPAPQASCEIACPSRLGNQRNCIRLLDGTARGTIGDIGAREFERPPAIIAAAGVELRGMVRESEQMPPQELIEAGPRGIELSLGLFDTCLAQSAHRQGAN